MAVLADASLDDGAASRVSAVPEVICGVTRALDGPQPP